jgi:hypothetical protein
MTHLLDLACGRVAVLQAPQVWKGARLARCRWLMLGWGSERQRQPAVLLVRGCGAWRHTELPRTAAARSPYHPATTLTVVGVVQGRPADGVLSPLAAVGLAADAVDGDGNRLVRLLGECVRVVTDEREVNKF